MTKYFREVRDPQSLLARERAPISGRRVPQHRSKRDQESQSVRLSRRFPRWMLVTAVAAFAALSAAVIVAAVSGDNSSDTTTGTVPETGSQQSSTSAAVSPTVPLSAPSTAAQTTTTVVSTTSPVGGELVRLTSAAAATGVTVTPTDPNATATFNGS